MQNIRSRLILGVKFLFVDQFNKKIAAFFKTFGMEKDGEIIFVSG